MYLDNKLFLQALVEYKEIVDTATKNNTPLPQIPEFIGKCFKDICDHISRRSEFINYSYRDEMISDAYENCIQYWHTFDGATSNNPFGYFSRTVWNAFVRRINKEKRQQYIRYKMAFNSGLFDSTNRLTNSDGNAIMETDNLADNMHDFIQQYEQKMQDKKDLKNVIAAKKTVPKKKKKV